MAYNTDMEMKTKLFSVQDRTDRILVNLKASSDSKKGAMVVQFGNYGTVEYPGWRKFNTAFATTRNYHDIEDYLDLMGFSFAEYREPNPQTPQFDGWYVFDRSR